MKILKFQYDNQTPTTALDDWYSALSNKQATLSNTFTAANVLLNMLPDNIAQALQEIGTTTSDNYAIVLQGLFTTKNPTLALIAQEALSTHLCGMKDIKYPYEEHKLLYPKNNGAKYTEWSHGLGVISPHADDIYEVINTDLLSLTVANDDTACDTRIYNCDDLMACLSADEIKLLQETPALFTSGKNVQGRVIQRKRPIIEYINGKLRYNLDFRIDKDTGERMRADDTNLQKTINKLRENLTNCEYASSNGKTGTFIVLDNGRALHSRGPLPPCKITEDLSQCQRLLFRSKGQKTVYQNLTPTLNEI